MRRDAVRDGFAEEPARRDRDVGSPEPAHGNLAQAAKDLDVHRNTLVYRLERISELTELDLNDADNRLILHLALKIQRVLATISGRILG